MNIFALDPCPTKSAQMLANRHVVKMILESAQMLCTAHRVLDGKRQFDLTSNRKKTQYILHDAEKDSLFYKATHINHPCNIWVRSHQKNYQWLYTHFASLCAEYTKRYGKVHASERKLLVPLYAAPKNINNTLGDHQNPPRAMPDQYKVFNTYISYQGYYAIEKVFKRRIHGWKNRNIPTFISSYLHNLGPDGVKLFNELNATQKEMNLNANL
jgi:hypothetical protein